MRVGFTGLISPRAPRFPALAATLFHRGSTPNSTYAHRAGMLSVGSTRGGLIRLDFPASAAVSFFFITTRSSGDLHRIAMPHHPQELRAAIQPASIMPARSFDTSSTELTPRVHELPG